MKVTILGCGASTGVPLVGCSCTVCTSENPKDKRLRASVLVEVLGKHFLIDTSPDLREQSLRYNISKIDAVLYTHEHGDHSHGIDDIRRFNAMAQASIPIYGDVRTIELLKTRFEYAFRPPTPEYGWFRASATPHVITAGEAFSVAGVKIIPFNQTHGKITTLGFRIGNFAYSTDVNALDDVAFKILEGVEIWVVDAQSYSVPISHSNVEQTLGWIKRVNPRRAVLTHMGHEIAYDKIVKELPEMVAPAYDGMMLEIP